MANRGLVSSLGIPFNFSASIPKHFINEMKSFLFGVIFHIVRRKFRLFSFLCQPFLGERLDFGWTMTFIAAGALRVKLTTARCSRHQRTSFVSVWKSGRLLRCCVKTYVTPVTKKIQFYQSRKPRSQVRIECVQVTSSNSQIQNPTKGFILMRLKRFQIYPCLQLSSSIASFVWKPAHFEFRSYGGA